MLRTMLRRQGITELGMALFLLVLGAVVLIDATQIPASFTQRGPIGPAAVPFTVAGALLLTGVLLAVDVLRGHQAEPESGEDIDLSGGADWKTVLLLVGFFLANAVLIQPLGWPLSGALLFWGCAYAFGSRNYVRNGVIALAISMSTYLLFAKVLELELPAGVLSGVI